MKLPKTMNSSMQRNSSVTSENNSFSLARTHPKLIPSSKRAV